MRFKVGDRVDYVRFYAPRHFNMEVCSEEMKMGPLKVINCKLETGEVETLAVCDLAISPGTRVETADVEY